jgi:hypothetical protein
VSAKFVFFKNLDLLGGGTGAGRHSPVGATFKFGVMYLRVLYFNKIFIAASS